MSQLRWFLLIMTLSTACVAGAPKAKTEALASADTPACHSGFTYNQGWCMYTTNPTTTTYQKAVDTCRSMSAYAPSIHNKNDQDFWGGVAKTFDSGYQHFWLDAYCPITGGLYTWMDETATDYLGPSNELANCDSLYGYHVEHDGSFAKNLMTAKNAPALCVYNPSHDPTPTLPVSTTPKTLTSLPTVPSDQSTNYCACNPSSIYLDIVFIVDTSAAMPRDIVGDVTATIQSTLYGLTFGTDTFQSNIAAIAYADSVQTVLNFGDLKTAKDISRFSLPYLGGNSARTADAINQASAMITSNGRNFTRGVIVLLSNSFNEIDASTITSAADSFKSNGGILITIDYSTGPGVNSLSNIATTGYYIANAAADLDLNSDMLYALCDANCFCRDGLSPYNVANSRGRDVPNGCYHVSDFTAVYYAAEQNCLNQKGFVATIHDDDKNFFMTSLFPVKAAFWIGLEMTNDKGQVFEWADGSTDTFTNWAPGNPIDGMDCVYGQQQTGFNSPWFSAPCADPLKNSKTYACQLPPCSSEYDCWA